jgi:hypothetical protein
MRAHGFTADQLGTMVHMGFAAQTAERVVGTFGQTSEIKRFKITDEASVRWAMNGDRVRSSRRLVGISHIPSICKARASLPQGNYQLSQLQR